MADWQPGRRRRAREANLDPNLNPNFSPRPNCQREANLNSNLNPNPPSGLALGARERLTSTLILTLMRRLAGLNIHEIWNVTKSIANALYSMHSDGILHGDLTPHFDPDAKPNVASERSTWSCSSSKPVCQSHHSHSATSDGTPS